MKVTGYQLRHAIREAEHMRSALATRWDDSLNYFPGEQPGDPAKLMAQIASTEARLAALQVAQTAYNLKVQVQVLETTMSLCEAVKLVGGAGRMEKMWRSAAGTPKSSYYRERELTRSKDEVRAIRSISEDAALEAAKKAARFASALRQAIETGNAVPVDLDGVGTSLFE